MDTLDLSPLLEQLEDNIDDLQDTLSPLLKAPLSETAAKLPLLDRAKLYVSITYAIESILFCKHTIPYHPSKSQISTNQPNSIPPPQRHRRQTTPRLPRTNSPKAIFREDQDRRVRCPPKRKPEPEQVGRWTHHQACTRTSNSPIPFHSNPS